MRDDRHNYIVDLSFQVALKIVDFTEQLRQFRKFEMASQLFKSGTSIGANVREAQNAESKTDFILGKGTVSPKIGSELSGKAVMAIISALGLILLYISIRFEFRFALGAIAALVHDVLITLGLFSLLGYEISLPIIAAFLTIVGYSLNDTIVIFDRIRENAKASKREAYHGVVNRSINDSLSRTVVTSLTTFLVIFILWLFGGEVIHNFALAMIIGVIVGTYSSIYIASPIVVQLHENAAK